MLTTTSVLTLFLFLLMIFQLMSALNAQQALAVGCHQAEREALLNFKHSFGDPTNSHRLSSWMGEDCCEWEGVGCNNVTSFIDTLDLSHPYCQPFYYHTNSSYLTAPKLHTSLIELRHLTYLDLSCNDFQASQIPTFIGSFRYMRYLNLSYSNFTGTVPPQLGNLTRLQTLDLSSLDLSSFFFYNYFTSLSTDLHWISTLESLQYLNMGNTHLIPSWHLLNMPPSLRLLLLPSCDLDNSLLRTLFSNATTCLSNIQHLDLSTNFLNGSLIIPHVVANMTSLHYLDLSENYFTASIPSWFSNMRRLQHLDISFNSFQGPLPVHVFPNMTSLTYLDLSKNELNGSIPLSMGNMRQLTHLDLSYNSFSRVEGGTIMGILGNLCKLVTLDFSSNSIQGRIGEASQNYLSECVTYDLEYFRVGGNMIEGNLPSWLEDFKYMSVLDVSHNRIDGPIPISVGSLQYLEELDLSHNAFNGTLPQGMGRWNSLVHIDLSSNLLQGPLSEPHLAYLSQLKYLDLSFNVVEWNISSDWSPPFQLSELHMTSCKIQSQFPRWIGEQTKLKLLDLSDNDLSGELVPLFPSSVLSGIYIAHNQLTGPLPYFSSSQLIAIDLSYNLLSGPLIVNKKNDTIGTPIYQLGCLWFLDLQRNKFSGTIHDFWGGLEALVYINLSSNNLSGTIPLSVGLLSRLIFLKLSSNCFQGPVPPTLITTSSNLQIMDLGDNKLVGNIPSNLGGKTHPPKLQVLRLRGNRLVGVIPTTLCSIRTLQFIDFSHINLTGSIPPCFGDLLQMDGLAFVPSYPDTQDDSTLVVLKGAELQYTTTLKYFVNLDLSCNALTGSIPEEITKLSALIGLNLSYNHLTGNIPQNIGEMRSLESLDLSNNSLAGTIPSGLAILTSLSSLNLSNNKLQGQIPTGRQLQTLDDAAIYKGNPGLCGDPLPNKCKTSQVQNQQPQQEGEEEEGRKKAKKEKPLLYLVIFSGFATGFWGVVGSLVLKHRFRFAVFQVVDNIADYFYVQVMIRLNRLRN